MNPELSIAILRAVFSKIQKNDCIVFLFGSYVSNQQVPSSDLDVGLLCNHGLSAKDFLAIQEEIHNTSPSLRKVDLVDFAHVSDVVKKEALKEVELWHVGKNCHELLKILKMPQKN